MVNKQKIKGTKFEKDAVDLLNKGIRNSKWKRVPSSGAIGTILGEASLTGDIRGEVESFPKKFKGEAKTGYSNSTTGEAKSFSLKKNWLDKISQEAQCDYSFPFLVGHFENARSGVKNFIVLSLEDFMYLLNYITEIQEELDERMGSD